MGFGLLLIGYFTATLMSFNIFGSFFKLVGFLISAKGIKKLSAYNDRFGILLYSCAAMIAISALCAVCDLSDFLYTNLFTLERIVPENVANIFTYVKYALEFVFSLLLCSSVASIAKETGAPKIVYIAVRNLVIYCVYFVLQVICWIPAEAVRAFLSATALPAWVLILNLLIVILNVLMLFSCYTKICDEGDEDMPQKPSRFEFVNKMREERAQREAQRLKRFQKRSADVSLSQEIYSDEQKRRSEAAQKKKRKNK